MAEYKCIKRGCVEVGKETFILNYGEIVTEVTNLLTEEVVQNLLDDKRIVDVSKDLAEKEKVMRDKQAKIKAAREETEALRLRTENNLIAAKEKAEKDLAELKAELKKKEGKK